MDAQKIMIWTRFSNEIQKIANQVGNDVKYGSDFVKFTKFGTRYIIKIEKDGNK